MLNFFIDNKAADFNELAMSFVYANQDDGGRIQGSHSKRSIKLPKTANNDLIFSNQLDVRTPRKSNYRFRIEKDGLVVIKGKLLIDGGALGKTSEYSVILVSDNADWGIDMKDLTFRDIPISEHTFSKTQIESANAGNDWTNGYNYILPKTGKWEQIGFVSYNEHTPALYVKYVILEAFKKIGYSVVSDFIDSDFFSRLIIPCVNKHYSIEYLKERTFVKADTPIRLGGGQGGVPISFSNQIIDNSNTFNNSYWNPPVNGKYKISTAIYGTDFNGNTVVFPCQMKINGILQLFPTVAYHFEVDLIISDNIEFTIFGLGTVSSGTLEITYISHIPNVTNLDIPNATTNRAFVNLTELMGDFKISDLLQDLKQLFNLVFDTDVLNNKVRIEPMDSWDFGTNSSTGFYTNIENVEFKIDQSKPTNYDFGADSSRYYSVDYLADASVEWLEKNEKVKLYSYDFDKGAGFNGDKQETKLSMLSKCMHIQDSEVGNNVFFPLLFSENWYEKPNPTATWESDKAYLLYYQGPTSNVFCKLKDGAVINNSYQYPQAWMVNYNDLTKPNLSLSDFLLQLHLRKLARLKNTIICNNYCSWNSDDLAKSIFDKKYYFDESYWILQKIDGYDPLSTKTTKTIFLKDSVFDYETIGSVASSPIKGLINV